MALIIAATDFSNTGNNAVDYACSLASTQNADMIIIHSYMIPIMFCDVPVPATMIIDDTQHDAEKHMEDLVARVSHQYPDVHIRAKVVYGDIVDTINKYSEEDPMPHIIVVGNNSATEINTWPDSTLYETFKKIKHPVLAVPPMTKYKPVRRICFAFDNKHTHNYIAFSQLKELTRQFDAELHVLNIQSDVHSSDNRQDFDDIAKTMLEGTHTTFHMIYDRANINQGIETFIEDYKMDILVMIPRKHSFFEGLFHRSHTKVIAHHTHIPILALHKAGQH